MPISNTVESSSPVAGFGTPATRTLRNERFADNPTLTAIALGEIRNIGDSSEATAAVQAALLDMGFALRPYTTTSGYKVGGVDGDWGPQTERAVVNFQRHAAAFFPDVRPTGEFDRATLRALDALAPAPGKKAWDAGQPCRTPTPIWKRDGTPLRVVVVKNEHRTFMFDDSGKISGVFANSIGKGSTPTDIGLKKVTGKLGLADARRTGSNLWGDPGAFGVRIIDLSWADGRRSGEELHGTFKDAQLGMDVSHGCMRHHNEDILLLFSALSVGDRVAVVERIDAPELAGASPFRA
ncbi:MAG: murein L,D-transpeptidase [Deltaproteobacteria bacterium]|nr:murein L,D-transpeptidase [Deltaproteobacteria bacterium]